MSTQKLAVTRDMLESPKSVAKMFDVVPFRDNFINNYLKTTGKQDGEIIWEREKIMFMQKVLTDKKFEKCNRLSIYSSFIELAASGLSLIDGQTYIVPYKDKATFQIGWRGRLEQIARIEGISELNEPVVVYESDDFNYALGDVPKIIEHKRTQSKHEGDEITHVYIVYVYNEVRKCMIMEADEVYNIRDNFSESYKYYMKMGGKWQDGNPMELPFALGFPVDYFKKTIIKRLYKFVPKSDRMINLDRKITARPDVEESQEIDYGVDKSEMTPEEKEAIQTPKVIQSESKEDESF